jgi:hypothetical protein
MNIPILPVFLGFILLVSCSTKQKKTEEPTIKEIKTPVKKVALSNNLNLRSNDSATYIGFIESFYPNDEPYIEVYFNKDNLTYEEYTSLSETGDSVIYKDDENERTRIPGAIATKNFDLSGLEPLYLFSKDHKFLSKAHIKRVEFLNQNISPSFIAVFDNEKSFKEKAQYAIGNLKSEVKPVVYEEFKDTVLANQIASKFNLANIEATHFKSSGANEIYSVINSDAKAYLIEKLNGNLKIVYASPEEEYISDLIFITQAINQKPVLLAHCVMPEGDMQWTNLLLFDGKKYKSSDRQRLK